MEKRATNPGRPVRFSPAGSLARRLVLALAAGCFPFAPAARPQSPDVPPASQLATLAGTVHSNELFHVLRQLTGEDPVGFDRKPLFINTRHTTSGAPLRRALQFAGEQLAATGLPVEFRGWSRARYTNCNLIATQTGTSRPTEFIWFTAHLDVRNLDVRAPGADDNASGCTAVLTAARVLSQRSFARSIRYVLFTGEEQGGLGSAAEAERARATGEIIAGVINADMIAWDKRGPPVLRIVTRTNSHPQFALDLALARTITNVIQTCGLGAGLSPIITMTGNEASDHASFWEQNIPAVLVTEDFLRDANPYYHTPKDTVARVNGKYFLAAAQALVAGIAELAGPIDPAPSR